MTEMCFFWVNWAFKDTVSLSFNYLETAICSLSTRENWQVIFCAEWYMQWMRSIYTDQQQQ